MKEKILDYISQMTTGDEAITEDQQLLTTGLIDSMGIMRLMAYLEEEFSTTIPPADMTIENFKDVNAIVHYLESQS